KLRPRYEKELKEITDFIALGSPSKAKDFAKNISIKLKILLTFPHIGRKKDNNRRELIYKGYIVPYFINNDEILLLGIYKENLWEF
ncbi:MAG: type II toxin-antitoxin system RelE/ParE family toxin, partial [Campylobacteraceae bacterium]|nr:type II toxin-antitoxin system RelE/ParE family toxin [Campylobacteraceae bacterium]MDY4121879.1 type II toxin-antitoxin system RelE/ParE family toxin [Campylobacter sp.]